MKTKLKNELLYFVNKPAPDILSSQTLYELLLGCLEIYRITGEKNWLEESKDLADLITTTQNYDGGFNIGYDFIFGKNMKKKNKKESTTPEVLSLFALKEYFDVTGDRSVIPAIEKGKEWILNNIVSLGEGEYGVPYAPSTSKEIHITNATSFAAGTLALFTKEVSLAPKYIIGMNKYMRNQLEQKEKGSYWRYFDRYSSTFESNPGKEKIDNYHIAQQLRYHSVSHKFVDSEFSLIIVKEVREYLMDQIDENGWISYIVSDKGESQKIDLWGYASVLKGLVESTKILESKNQEVKEKVNKIFENIYKYSWNGEHFNPIIFKNGKSYDKRFYPRSDAWVFHSIIKSYDFLSDSNKRLVLEISGKNYQKIKKSKFRGFENHAVSNRKLVFSKLVSLIRQVKK